MRNIRVGTSCSPGDHNQGLDDLDRTVAVTIAGGGNVGRDAWERLSQIMASEEQRLFVEIKNHVKGLHSGSRFIRWQEIRIKQLGFVNNAVLVLSSAIVSFVARSENLPTILEKWGIISLLLSILFGLFCAWTRLWDFRLTAQLARVKAGKDCGCFSNPCIICRVRHKVEELGECSWMLLRAQLFTFAVGISLAVVKVITAG